jgi:hypothetical protein
VVPPIAKCRAPGESDLLAPRATVAAGGNEGKPVPSKKGAAIKRSASLSAEGGNGPIRDGVCLRGWMIGNGPHADPMSLANRRVVEWNLLTVLL